MSSIAANKLGKKKEMRLWTFLLGLATASAFFIPFILRGDGYFMFYGDFNVQQIPFYQHCHEMVRSGDFWGWDWQTDLGANFIGSYSFYLLGSPFFWLTLPFPTSFVPYLMGPLLILKFACASLTAYMFIRRFTARPESAMIGGLLYAFSGFSVYNIFFNHFHEAIVVFPLLLLAMEKFMAERSRGVLILAVFIATLTNYFFFFGMVVFVIIYWAVRMLSKSFSFDIWEFLLMLLECVLGLTLAAAVMLPTVLEVMQNDRLSSLMNGWGAVMYGKEQIFLNVIECFFFPPDLPARPVFFPGAEVKWSSLGGWMPLLGMTGVITWLQAKKKGSWQRRVLAICIVMALIPGLNAAFSMLNTAYYARWFFMPILLMCLVTAIALEDTEVDWNSSWRWSAGITAAFTLVIGFLPTVNSETGEITKWGLYTDASTNPIRWVYQTFCRAVDGTTEVTEFNTFDTRFWTTVAIALLSVVAVRALIPIIKEKRKAMFAPIIGLVCLISAIYPCYFIFCGQEHSYNRSEVMTDALIEGDVTVSHEDEFFRVDVYDGVDNTGLYLDMSSINFFHSIVPASITEFYDYIGIDRSVASRPEMQYSALRPFLSVKYMLDPNIENSKEFSEDEYEEMLNFTLYGKENAKLDYDKNGIVESEYDIYLNQNYIPMGFTYEYYIDEKTLSSQIGDRRVHTMLKALLVEEKDIPQVSQYLTNIKNEHMIGENYSGIKPLIFGAEGLKKDCEARKVVSAHSFKTSSEGFKAYISMDRDNLVFFSVPYHEGWTAKVNGVETEIFRVNKGFMAVVAPEGVCEIEFEFQTPGLKWGLAITLISMVIISMYLGAVAIKRSFRPTPSPEYPEGDVIRDHIERYEAAVFAAENPEDDYLLDNIDHSQINAYVGFTDGFTIDNSALDEFQSGEISVDMVDETEIKSDEDIPFGNAVETVGVVGETPLTEDEVLDESVIEPQSDSDAETGSDIGDDEDDSDKSQDKKDV